MKIICKLLILMVIGGCASHSGLVYTFIPNDIENPKIDKIQDRVYDCNSKIHKCIDFKNYKEHDFSDYKLEQAHLWLLHVIQKMNSDFMEQYGKKCAWYQFQCKKEHAKLPPLGKHE